jgi:hypothetical protein
MNTDSKPCHRALIYIMESTQFLKRMCYEIYWVYINVRMDIFSSIRRAPQLFKLFYRCSSFFEFLRYFVQARRWKRESSAKGIHLQEFRGGDSEHGLQYRLSNCWLRHFTGPYYSTSLSANKTCFLWLPFHYVIIVPSGSVGVINLVASLVLFPVVFYIDPNRSAFF